MTLAVLKVAVVGHTNTGKTSLLRTLNRDVSFGEVSIHPGTTREVDGGTILVQGEPAIELFDTPGLEDSMGLLETLIAQKETDETHRDGHSRVLAFLEGELAGNRFLMEARALRQVLECDLALYVIDVRDRVHGKHRDEMEILGWCARPVVPVLNFTASPVALTQSWRDMLARVNMHAVAEFDTVVLTDESEMRLFETMRTLLDRFRPTIDAVIDDRRRERTRLIAASSRVVAELLIDAAAFVLTTAVEEDQERQAAVTRFRDRLRERENACVTGLLELHRFRPEDCIAAALPLEDGQWGLDLFSPASLQKHGIRSGGAAGAGALIGLGIDAAVGGASLGAGAAIGGAIGALAGAARAAGKRVTARLRGRIELRSNPQTLRLLAARQIELVALLLHRGHASQEPVKLETSQPTISTTSRTTRIAANAARAAAWPEWSRLNDEVYRGGLGRDAAIDTLTALIRAALDPTDAV